MTDKYLRVWDKL